MKNKFSKFINLQGKYLTSLLFVLFFAVGQMWGATALEDLNFSGITAAPSAYTYSSSNTPSYQSSQGPSGDKRPCMLIGNGGKGQTPTITSTGPTASTGKRWMAFCPAEDCDVAIVCTGNGKIFKLFDANHNIAGGNVDTISVYLSSYTGTSSWTTWNVKGLKAGTWYVLSASSSSSYVTSMQFTAKKYWLAFDANGHGTAPDTIKSLKKDSIIPAGSKPADPTASNYNFGGWYSNAACTGNAWVWGTSKVTQDTTLYAKWTPAGGTQSAIEYTYTKSATPASTLPTTYYEGTGIASFPALNDVTGFHFTGWSPASISTSATGKQTIEAQWVAAYDVTFSAGAGSGTVPAAFQKWEGATFDLPDQGSMVAPSGKAFDGWKANGTGSTLDAGSEYTMGNAAVNFVAQWKAAPQTIFHWRADAGTTTTDAVNGTTTGGTVTLRSTTTDAWGTESVTYNASVAADMKATSTNEMKSGKNAVYLELALTSGTFQEDDTIYVTGYNTWGFSTSSSFTSWDVDSVVTGATGKGDVKTGYGIIKSGVSAAKIYVRRGIGSGSGIAAIKVIRPAARPISSTEISLTDVKVNGRSISSDSLAILKTASAYALTLGDEFVTAPEIKFNEHKVITYADELLPATKVTDKVYTVTATLVDGNWQAQQEIDGNTYTVKAPKQSSVKLAYYDGATKLGEETVGIGGHPAEYAAKQSKDFATFVAWYSNSDLAEEHKIADIAELVVNEATNVYGKWTPAYASSINIEQWVLDNGVNNTPFRAELTARNYQYTSLNNLDSLNDDPSKPYRNYAYLGQKVNKTDSEIKFLLKSGSTLNVRFGHLGSDINVVIGSADPVALTSAEYANDAPGDKKYTYTATEDVIVKFQCTGTSTSVFKQIMIDEAIAAVTLPWLVTYDANGGTCATAEAVWSGAALILPDVTPADADHTFAGWYDEVSGGELQGVAGASYTPTDNETLFAHFAPVEYAVAYDGNGATSGSMSASAAGWGTLVTPAVNAFEKTGNIFAGWVITKTSDGSATGITFSEGKFEMPKYDVTLVAQWEDVSKVAVIVETNVKYETLAAAIAAAEAGQTIQLLQNIEQANGVAIAKNLTLDLNGKTFTCTSGSNVNYRAIKITAGTVTIQNGSIIAVPTANFEGGAYGPLRIEGATANVTLEDLTLRNGRHYGLGIKLVEGYLRMEDCTVISENGGGGLEVAGTADVINCTFTQTGLDNAHAWISTCLATCDNGVLNVQGGTYTSEHYSMYVYTSGGEMDVESGSFTGDVVNQVTLSSYPDAVGAINISGGSFEGAGGNPIQFTTDNSGATSIAISGGTFDAPVENEYCAPGYVPSPADPVTGKYSVEPKDGVEIIGVVVTGNTTGDVSGLYKGDASVNLNSKKIDSGKYIYVTLKEGYTFEETDVLIVDVNSKASIGTKALEITTGVGNIDGDVWTSIAYDDYATGENIISLEGIAANQTSIGLKRSDNQNAKINGIRVLRPMKPMLTAITIDGRDGVIDEANKTVAVQIPYEANLAALTVVPTIVWNEAAATNSIVVNDGSAWIEGANTYKLTDKDGDYTVYTITLTRDVQKHTVSFNTHGGSAVASEEVEHNAYLAAAPTAPTKEDYIFQYWSLTEDGAEVDVTTVQIDEDKEFHAVWASDGAIKLLDGSTVNHTNFITAVTATETVEFMGNTVNYAKFSGTVSGVNGVKDLTRVIAYNATTNKTKIQISAHNNSTSARNILVKGLVEGADAAVDLATIALGNKEDKVSEWIEFDNAANRTIYIMVSSSAGDVYFTQVKVIESGETPMKQAGEAGYSLNLNKGRFFGTASTDLAFEGLNARLSGDYTALNSGYAKLNATSMSFTVASDMLLTVTANNNKTYYVTKGAAGTDNETAKTGATEFNLTAGTWFITAGGSEVQLTNIAFALPKCEAPVFGTMEDIELCATEAIPAIDGTATVSDGGDVTYKWYAEGDAETVLATTATYTPAADGSFYVVATNSLAGHQDVSATSVVVKVSHFASVAITTAPEDVYKHAGLDAELSVVAEGKNVTYEWFTCDDELGTTPVAIVPAETGASLNLTAIEAGIKYYQVVVTDECGTTASAVAKVEGFNDIALVDVTGNMFWDFSKASDGTTATSGMCNEAVLVNVPGIVNNSDFESDNIMATANKFSSGKLQASMIKFHTTVNGLIKVIFSNTGTKTSERYLVVNGQKTASGSKNSTAVTYYGFVPAGDVELTVVDGDGNMLNFTSVKFIAKAAPDYVRDDSWMAPGELGTFCIPQGAVAVGADMYELMGRDPESGKIAFDNVEHMEPGKPYLFRSNSNQIDFYYTDEAEASEPDNSGAMKGSFTNYTITEGLSDIYYFNGTALWCADALGQLDVIAYRAYVQMDEVVTLSSPSSAPGRRRILMGVHGEQTATGVDNVQSDDVQCTKLMIDGQMYILRGEQMYDATGRLVK